MDVVDSCLKCEKCEIKAMMWTPVWAQNVTIWWQQVSIQWQHVTVQWQYTPIWLQSAQKNNARLGTYVLKTVMT